MAHIRHWFLRMGAALLGGHMAVAQAVDIAQVVPQGAVNEVRQVVVQTSADAVRLGNAQAPAPVVVQCMPAQSGTGRWNNAREWVWQADAPLPAGTRCNVLPEKSFKSPSGAELVSFRSYQFEVSGPHVLEIWPATYEAIDEAQSFLLRLNGAATPQSVAEHVYCRADDVGERIPVQLLNAVQTEALRTALHLKNAQGSYVALACNRRLTAGSSMQLVYGAGVSMPSGVSNRIAKKFDYTVREAFTAEMQCQRERANAGCLPIRDVVLSFSAPVPVEQAKQVQLVQGAQKRMPKLDAEDADMVTQLRFPGPFTPLGQYQLQLPEALQDDAGRRLANARSFPLTLTMGDTPPLVKFAAAPFGVLERFADGPDGVAVLPVTVRKMEGVGSPVPEATVRHLHLQQDADIIRWWDKVQRYDREYMARKQARQELRTALPQPVDETDQHSVATRTVSLLQGESKSKAVRMPQAQKDDPRALEVVGIPLSQPGLHVLEVESPRLGAALLDERLGTTRPMFVRTSALVTNLALHFKLGREGSAVWVTSLDQGKPVAGAQVQVSDCRGQVHAAGTTDSQGVLLLPDLGKEAPRCTGHEGSGAWFASARQRQAGVEDVAFVWSDWQRGIEPWRFNVPTGWGSAPELSAHTVLDRNLVRAGETVSMKHFVRAETLQGLALPKDWPVELWITHVGSNQQFKQPLQWQDTRNGGRNAVSHFEVPKAAKLGLYTVEMRWPESARNGQRVLQSGEFRVEAFRLPVFQGSVQPVHKGALIAPKVLPVTVSLSYLNGGAANGQAVQVSALLRDRYVDFARWNDYSFRSPRAADETDRDAEESSADGSALIADKLPVRLDAQGQGQVEISNFPAITRPQDLLLEASFADPNGEIQTLRSTHSVWSAAVLAGIRTEGWMSVGRKMRLQALAVDTQGQPQAGVPLKVHAVQHITTSTRKRLVGGFYSYDNQRSSKNLGEICSGKSDARGLLLCEAQVLEPGEVELVVSAQDKQGRTAQAADTVWVTGQGELWFGGQDHDRMDVLAEKPSYAPGEIAKLQVRMPFREATALVSVEREGVLYTEVVNLKGKDPTIELPVQEGWGPNVYVSVLALRGRLYEVPWYSFFTWGYKAPRQWWNAFWHGGKEYVAPTAMVDLSKPSFRFGVAELQVQDPSNKLQVTVQADKSSYQTRDTAQVTIRATLPNGKPAAYAEVAVAAVDKALLELSPNRSWDLRKALWQRRSWSVNTATAQMEVVGRRHYGRKAAAPGGGGGAGAPTRELLDTLLLWLPQVQLDAQGQAVVQVPLNDALTSFTVVAVADDGVQRFGTGSTDIRTSQDLQIISGLPPVVRESDEFRAMVTVRNSTDQAMEVKLQPSVQGLNLTAQTVAVSPQSAREVTWNVTVPNGTLEQASQGEWLWRIEARDTKTGAKDSLAFSQLLLSAVPLTVQQATILQIDSHWEQALSWPEQAEPGRGGVRLEFSDKLADKDQGVPGLRDWWAAYPYVCLEQTVGKAIGLGDVAMWQRTMAQLPTYLDGDGLAMYFPPQNNRRAQGSDSLTAHLLSVNHSMQSVDPRLLLPAAEKVRMENGLIAFVEGRIERKHWSPRQDLDVRKLAAIAALARSGKARPAMLQTIRLAPQEWPTHAVIDWLSILQQMPQLPEHEARMTEAQQVLKARLSYQGSQVGFSTDAQDHWWWLMQGVDVNLARLLLTTMEDSSWDAERVRLVTGLLARQKKGAWGTTTANTWAGLALRAFSQRYERDDVTGNTTALLGTATKTVHWNEQAPSREVAVEAATALPAGSAAVEMVDESGRTLFLPWGERRMGNLDVQHRGKGKPWVGLQSVAAVPRTQPLNAGYALKKTVTPVQGANSQKWLRGDVVRIRLEVNASADMTWVALSDPLPAGATILGSGLGRDSSIAQQGEGVGGAGEQPAFVERGQDSYRAYWSYLPQGVSAVEYTVRLNNAGNFALPPTRVEALYAPEMFGELPNARWKVATPE